MVQLVFCTSLILQNKKEQILVSSLYIQILFIFYSIFEITETIFITSTFTFN